LVSVAAIAVQASPLKLVPKAALDVYVPTIIYPTAETVWNIGKVANVTWDTSNAPKHISNRAAVYLREADLVLAKDFDLRSGFVNFTVPVVPLGQYQITLFGDSGDWSPCFQIEA
ncbi:hypothetical protein BDQ17DRAFT_1284548, partial [Cyathus striatus]